ncbi:hypothetical protein [Micromonospora auratinigra]|uniref:Uncharacterized protein n=1 Tax=Micromonospora auratinigra TaxID=261654 RepID=A0A1A8ZDN8_9ACTN|nr:hypothetical protein [Micromonospora auratinigra]SBT41938.1 hypothetical protein GA0070611_1802 [Micromonospora auratinigra]
MRRRILLVAAVVLVLAAAGGLLWYRTSPQVRYHRSAVADAGQKVDGVLRRFDHDHLHKADDYAHTAAQQPDVTVLAVTGETHWQTGVTLVLGVVGHGRAYDRRGKLVAEGDERICFRLRLGPHDDRRDDDVECPSGDPLPVTPDPSLDGVDERLTAALAHTDPDEAAVRAAVAGLRLDPAVRQEVAGRAGTVGVALRAAQYDCLLAQVTAAGVRLWRPSHTQLAPGELPCTTGTALSSAFGRSPH